MKIIGKHHRRFSRKTGQLFHFLKDTARWEPAVSAEDFPDGHLRESSQYLLFKQLINVHALFLPACLPLLIGPLFGRSVRRTIPAILRFLGKASTKQADSNNVQKHTAYYLYFSSTFSKFDGKRKNFSNIDRHSGPMIKKSRGSGENLAGPQRKARI